MQTATAGASFGAGPSEIIEQRCSLLHCVSKQLALRAGKSNFRFRVRDLPRRCAAVKVRCDMSTAQSRRSGIGPLKSRLLGAHCGWSWPARPFSKAETMSVKRFRQLWVDSGRSVGAKLERPQWVEAAIEDPSHVQLFCARPRRSRTEFALPQAANR
jgi:hypothetical protein